MARPENLDPKSVSHWRGAYVSNATTGCEIMEGTPDLVDDQLDNLHSNQAGRPGLMLMMVRHGGHKNNPEGIGGPASGRM
jgi:hypothetical protein